ncbi:MAG: hypothetical protein A2081_02795 [Elusimicrobia bacterium GWC2_61_19]|nr:MAG: hypothetical protein A2081_02795 [Elusimicrobia bacterium GWC2_61_19]
MKYTGTFFRLTVKELGSSYQLYLSVALLSGIFYLLLSKIGPALADPKAAGLAAGQLVYSTLSSGIVLVFLFLQPVFLSEKREGTIIPLLCSPAGANDLLFGKCAGVTAVAMAGSLLSLAFPLAFSPVIFKAMLAPGAVAAVFIVSGIVFSYVAITGMLLLCLSNVKVVYPALFFMNYVPVALNRYSKGYMQAHGLGGANWLHLLSLAIFLLFAASMHRFYFTKQRIVRSA